MKNKYVIIGMILCVLLAGVTSVQAATATATLTASSSEAKSGDTVTVTLSVSCEDGINGIDTTYSYDKDKLELVSANVNDSTNWASLGTDNQITVIANSTSKITNADIYVLTFKVKDNIEAGTNAKVTTTEIMVDSDSATNSENNIEAKEVLITIVEESAGDVEDNKPEEKPEEKPDNDENKNNVTENTDSTNQNTNKPSNTQQNTSKTNNIQAENDNTQSISKIPHAGKNVITILGVVLISIVAAIIYYKKYNEYKGV